MANLILVEPSLKYKNSFKKYVLVYKKISEIHYYNKYIKALEDFNDFLNNLENCSNGINLSASDVPTSSFWLVDNNEVVGVVRIRHREVEFAGHIGYDISPSYRKLGYGSQILKLAIEKAKKLEINKIVITCNINNLFSKKIIEKNGGVFVSKNYDIEEKDYLLKFVINT